MEQLKKSKNPTKRKPSSDEFGHNKKIPAKVIKKGIKPPKDMMTHIRHIPISISTPEHL